MNAASIAAAIAAYLLGSVSFALVVSRAFRLPDPRSFGSGNPGATNVLRSGNKLAAALTLAGDALKGFVAVALVAEYGPRFGIDHSGVALAALAAFLGHLFPVWFGFKGGKGVATALGILFALDTMLGGICLATWLAVFALTRISSVSALTATALAPVAAWVRLGRGPVFFVVLLIAVLVVLRHRSNIAKLLQGNEGALRKQPSAGGSDHA